MNYKKIYNQLIERAENRSLDGYKERHHIVPRCLGGTDDRSNLVDLTPEEHFVAHQLLVKIYPNEEGLVFACLMMCRGPNGKRNNNRLFGWIKRKNSDIRKTLNKDNCEWIKCSSEKKKGRTAETCESVYKATEKLNIFSKELRDIIVQKCLETNCLQTYKWLIENGYQCAYISLCRIFRRECKKRGIQLKPKNRIDKKTKEEIIELYKSNIDVDEIIKKFNFIDKQKIYVIIKNYRKTMRTIYKSSWKNKRQPFLSKKNG